MSSKTFQIPKAMILKQESDPRAIPIFAEVAAVPERVLMTGT